MIPHDPFTEHRTFLVQKPAPGPFLIHNTRPICFPPLLIQKDLPCPLSELILLEADSLLVVNKPAGLLVHPSRMARDAPTDLVSLLREATGHMYHPCHRLDRATSGVLILARDADVLRTLNESFSAGEVKKEYLSLVRGWLHEPGIIDYPLRLEDPRTPAGTRPTQAAVTHYRPLARFEHPVSAGRYPTTRLTLCALAPGTGRRHQLRRHMAHLRHPVIGDTTHGDGRLNRWAREHLGAQRLFLHARCLRLPHPLTGKPLHLEAEPGPMWQGVLEHMECYRMK